MPMPPPLPTHLMRQDSDEDALSLGQGEDTKPLASVPKAQSTPRRQYINSLVSELDFGKIPGLGPTQAAAAPAQHSAATSVAAAEEPVHYHVPLHPAPAPRKPKPAIVPSFDFSQLPDYAGPAQSISVELQPMGSFQASSSSSADALPSPRPQPQPQPPRLPPRQSKAPRKPAAAAGDNAAVLGSKAALPRGLPAKGATVMGPEAHPPEARQAASAAERPKEGVRPPRRQGGGGLDFLARLELVEQQEAHKEQHGEQHREQHMPRGAEAPPGASVSAQPKAAAEASATRPSAPPPLPAETLANQLSQPLSKAGALGRRLMPPMHAVSPKPPGAVTAKGASSSSRAKVPQRSQSARPSGVVHPFMRAGSGAASAASAASAARAARAAQERRASPAAGARQHGVIGKGGPVGAKQNTVIRKGGVAASAKQGSIDGRNGGLAAGAGAAGRGALGGGRGGRGRWVPTPSPVERVASSKAAAQPSAPPRRPSLAESMGSTGGKPSGAGGSVAQKRQSSAAIPNGKHTKQKTT